MKIFKAISILMILASNILANNKSKNRPNILFAFADDWGKYASIYSKFESDKTINSVVRTPNFDRLAEKGVLFTNAYVNSPSCTPCRSSILTGQYFYRTGLGAILLGATWDYSRPAFPIMLEKQGYHIGYTYKVWGPGIPMDAPFVPEKHEYINAGREMNSFSQTVDQAENVKDGKGLIYQEVLQNFKDFLSDKDEDEPFFYWFGPTNTHRKWVKGSGKRFWQIEPDSLKGKIHAAFPDVPEIREDIADYLGEVQGFDAALGVLVNYLIETGEFENTIIVVSGDHGIPGFPHAKTNLYDLGTSVSLGICFGNHIKGGRTIYDFVNLMDLAPTFLDLAGIDIPDVMTGRSLMQLLKSDRDGWIDPERNFVVTGRERHVDDANENFLPYPMRSYRTKDFLYIRNFKTERWPVGIRERGYKDMDNGPTKDWLLEHHNDQNYQWYLQLAFGQRPYEELYDLKVDPDQIKNVVGIPAYSSILDSLSYLLDSVLIVTKDPRMFGDGNTFDNPPHSSEFVKPDRNHKTNLK